MAKKVTGSKALDSGVEIQYDDGSSTFSQYTDKDLGSNFQYLKNPTTNKSIAIGKGDLGLAGNLSDVGGFVPIGAKDINTPTLTPGGNVGGGGTTDNTGGTDLTQGGTKTSIYDDLDSGLSVDEIRDEEAAARRARRDQAESIFGPRISRARETGEQRVGSATGQMGVGRGLGASTARMGFINQLEKQADDTIRELENDKAAYISTGDYQAMQRADDRISKLKDQQLEIQKAKFNEFISTSQLQQSERRLDLSEVSTQFNVIKDIPAGETINIGGMEFTGINTESADPFFKGSDIVQLMKEIPAGTTEYRTDPNTGRVYEIQGVSSEDPNVKITNSYGDDGRLTVTRLNLDTGEMTQFDGGIVGKTKTQASNVTLNLTQGQSDALGAAAAVLNASRGGGGEGGNTFWNTDDYIEERDKYAATPGADVKDFDNQYAWNLSTDPIDTKAKRILETLGKEPKKKNAKDMVFEAIGDVKFDDN